MAESNICPLRAFKWAADLRLAREPGLLLTDSVPLGATGSELGTEVGDNGSYFVTLFQSHTQHSRRARLVLGGSMIAWSSPDSNSRVRRKKAKQEGAGRDHCATLFHDPAEKSTQVSVGAQCQCQLTSWATWDKSTHLP